MRIALQAVHKFCELRFIIRSFVLVNDISFGQSIQHARYLLEQFLRFCLVGSAAQTLYKRASGLVLVTVSQTLSVVRSDSL